MLANTLLWNTRHPRNYLPEDYHVYLAQDGKTEILGPGWETDQNFIMSLIDPFGWFLKKDPKQKAFWEDNGFARGAYGGVNRETANEVSEQLPLTRSGRQDV
jgi:hypothetical protein